MDRTKSIHKLYELWDRPGISERIDRWRSGFTTAMTEEFFEQITETLLALGETERAGQWAYFGIRKFPDSPWLSLLERHIPPHMDQMGGNLQIEPDLLPVDPDWTSYHDEVMTAIEYGQSYTVGPKFRMEARNQEGMSLLLQAAQYQPYHFEVLLQAGMNPLRKNSFGWDAFHLKCANCRPRYSETRREDYLAPYKNLLNLGASVHTRNHFGDTPLMNACMNRALDLCHFLLQEGASPNAVGLADMSALSYAFSSGQKDMALLMLQFGGNPRTIHPRTSYSPLMHALEHDWEDVFELLLKAGVDLNHFTREQQNTALHLASSTRKTLYLSQLLEAGANPDFQNQEGQSPLMLAVINFKDECVRILLEGGANPNLQNSSGDTALMLACVFEDPQIVAMLLKAGANQDIRNARGQSALEIARIRGATDLESLLLSAGQ